MSRRTPVIVLVVLAVLSVGALALLTPNEREETLSVSSEDTIGNPPDGFAITVRFVDGTTQSATAVCEGPISGTGYLAAPDAAFNACTAHSNSHVAATDYLMADDPHSVCDEAIEEAAKVDFPIPPPGRATIKGSFFRKPINLQIDGSGTGPCGRAMWELLGPMFVATHS